MKLSSPHYLPLPLPYFSVLAFVLLVLIVVIERRALRYAHSRLGLGSRGALLVLIASLVGRQLLHPPAGTGFPDLTQNQELMESVFFLLNYYEFLAAGLRRGVLSEDLFRDDQANIVNHLYKNSVVLIDALRKEKGRPGILREFEWLHRRWSDGHLRRFDRVLEWLRTRPRYRVP
jgi:hypothetical protein